MKEISNRFDQKYQLNLKETTLWTYLHIDKYD